MQACTNNGLKIALETMFPSVQVKRGTSPGLSNDDVICQTISENPGN